LPVAKQLDMSMSLSRLKHTNTRIQLFFIDDTLWTGVPGNYTDKNAPEVLAEVRKLVDDKKYPEATTAAVKLSGAPSEVCNTLQIDITLSCNF
jgi:hypothetical protein